MIYKLMLTLCLFSLSQADTLFFHNGAVLHGKLTQQADTTVTIDVDNKKTTYSKNDIREIKIDKEISPPPPPPVTSSVEKSFIIQAGTLIHIKTLEPINTASHKKGHQFKVLLENNIVDKNNNVLVKKGSEIYGVVVSTKQAGRLIGKSEMIITLTAISIGSTRVNIQTKAINILAPKKQARDTTGKVLRGAVIGAMINGHDGARDGAKVGVGLALITKGKPTGIPAGTLLDFTITTETKIP